jgi:lipopolysaccharide export system protein LptC
LETVAVDAKIVPLMRTEDFSSLLSDSGVTRYRMKAKVWEVYKDSVPEPYWYYPEGFYFEKFDSVFNVEGYLKADTAYYYNEKQKLWRVTGNVELINFQGEKFETSELFWNQREKRIYTDKFIRIERKGQIHMGYGLVSNQEMSDWRILNHSGEMDIPENDTDSIVK